MMDAEQAEMVLGFMYDSVSEVFQPKKYYFKTDTEYSAPWVKGVSYSAEQLGEAFDVLEKHATMAIGASFFDGKRIEFESRFSDGITDVNDIVTLELASTDITNSTGKKIEFSTSGLINSYKDFDMGSSSTEWAVLTGKFDNSEDAGEGLSGSASVKAKAVTGYVNVAVSAKDVGSTIAFGDREFLVVDVFENCVVLDVNGQDVSDISFVNLNADGHEVAQVSYQAFEEMGINDVSYGELPGHSQSTTDAEMYDAFKANPSLSIEEFVAMFKDKAINGMEGDLKTYMVLQCGSPVEECVLYAPVYGVEKVITRDIAEQ